MQIYDDNLREIDDNYSSDQKILKSFISYIVFAKKRSTFKYCHLKGIEAKVHILNQCTCKKV